MTTAFLRRRLFFDAIPERNIQQTKKKQKRDTLFLTNGCFVAAIVATLVNSCRHCRIDGLFVDATIAAVACGVLLVDIDTGVAANAAAAAHATSTTNAHATTSLCATARCAALRSRATCFDDVAIDG